MKQENQTYEFICFSDLAYEFDSSIKKEIEKKIKRRLKYHKLGNYNQDRVDYIREIKNDLLKEISLGPKSKFYTKSNSVYSELSDFKIEEMQSYYHQKYNKIENDEMTGFINFSIYLYHLR